MTSEIAKEDHSEAERRQYIRLDSVFPVQFQLLSADGAAVLSEWVQGFTSNISKGGICLSVNNLFPQLAGLIKTKQVKLSLGIEMPLGRNPIPALAQVVWVQEVATQPNKYLIGLKYEQIPEEGNIRIMRYARTKRLFLPVALAIILVLGFAFTVDSCINVKLIRNNIVLVEQLINILQESSVAKQKIKEIGKEREDLQVRIKALELRIRTVEEDRERLGERESHAARKIEELTNLIEKLTQEKTVVQEELISVQRKESMITEELLRLDKRKASLEKANLDKMYQWLKRRQSGRTGLAATNGAEGLIQDGADLHEQSLLILAYAYFADFDRARKMLEFFNSRAQRKARLFFNSYRAEDGRPAVDSASSGPNVWLGIAILQYTHKTQDQAYLALAEEIGHTLISMQDADTPGGILGENAGNWHLAEHNIDTYAFFNMLHKITGKPAYLKARDQALTRFVKRFEEGTGPSPNRSNGDGTIATDTFVEAIAAVGPEMLEAAGINPERIAESSQQRFGVEVSYARPDGQVVKIKGFDVAPEFHAQKGGSVSAEFTAQMVIVYKILADFYYTKGMVAKYRSYLAKADEYLAQLGNMVISSVSSGEQGESCLPFATQDNVSTGNGRVISQASSRGSIASTAYTLFAYYNYNPLELKQ